MKRVQDTTDLANKVLALHQAQMSSCNNMSLLLGSV